MKTPVLRRRLVEVIADRMLVEPVLVLHGPRTVGKSTLLQHLATAYGRPVIDLDQVNVRQQATADPSFIVRAAPPVLIDEYQHEPSLLDAIKAELNVELKAGRFVLTGSTSYTTLPRAAQSLTGRAEVLTVWPFSQGELAGHRETFLEQLLENPDNLVTPEPSATSRLEYARRVLAGGMPIAVARDNLHDRYRWFANYLDLVIERDVLDIRRIRQRDAMPNLLRRLVGQTGQLLNISKAAEQSGLDRSLGNDYAQLLEAVFLVHRLPAWGTTLSIRVNALPKLHVVDTGLGGWLLGITTNLIAERDTTALQQFGHLLESFVVNELVKQASWLAMPLKAGHYRTKDEQEVDLVLQTPGEDVVGVEVKSGTVLRNHDLRGLVMLRKRLGSRFRCGVVLHTGDYAVRLGDRLYSMPVDKLWS